MTCRTYREPGLGKVIICTRGHASKLPQACRVIENRATCLRASGFLCDYPLGKGRTCDAPLCHDHAHEVGPDLHYCPKHFQATKGVR